MNWRNASNIEGNNYKLPGDWLNIEYFEALNILFRIENALRVFVYIILKNEFQDKWKNLSITSDDEESSTINGIAKKRIAQDKNYAYLGYTINSPLLHLTSGELIRIITSDSYWKLFKNYFPGTKEVMKNKLDEIGNVRNSVAHFRPIRKGDVELIKQNSIHALSAIEETIRDFINCPDIVPTNTEDQWYKDIRTINNQDCSIEFRQSQNEEWVKLFLEFNCSILGREKRSFSSYVKTVNLKVNNLLNLFSDLTKHTICVTETIENPYAKNLEDIQVIKNIIFTFSRKVLEKNYEVIKIELEKIIFQISKEVELIKEDNLARGKLIEAINASVEKFSTSNYYSLDVDQLQTDLTEDSPVEFWGALNYTNRNFVTETDRFPWMPVNISDDKEELPF